MKLQKGLREFVELLSSSGVEFIIVGGHAVAFHGHPRYTGDIDFLLRSTPENAERIIAALKAFGFGRQEAASHRDEGKAHGKGLNYRRFGHARLARASAILETGPCSASSAAR